ncbi:hypothetical protein AGMMS49991_02740 [Spirochaetia bacterium]|nr:hypothetical protein AGMMS49991_02740 [Spirochaetia bacterium]
MRKLQKIVGPRSFAPQVLAIFLLLVLVMHVSVQKVDAQQRSRQQETATLPKAMNDAGVWLGNHIAQGSYTALLNFAAPTRELFNYCSDRLLTGMNAMGIGTVIQLSGDIIDSDAVTISRSLGIQTIVIGSISPTENGCILELQVIASETGQVLGNHSSSIRMAEPLQSLLNPKDIDTLMRPAPVPNAVAAGIPVSPSPPIAPAPLAPPPIADFTTEERVLGALLNPLLGIGSITMGDLGGSLIIISGYALAVGLFSWEFIGIAPDIAKNGEDSYFWDKAGIPGAVAIGIVGLTTIFGILRPIFYHKPGSVRNAKVAAALKGINLAVVPSSTGIKSVHLGYSFKF